VVSVDTKKKENAGNFKNGGREWRPAGDPVTVNDDDFPDKEPGKAIPCGVYDVGASSGWVSVGTDHDTAQFAVQTIRTWWDKAGKAACPRTGRLLVSSADAGGANGYRTRLRKTGLAAFAAEAGITVTVCHLPPGTPRDVQVEQNRAPAILPHLDELAWQAADQPRGHRQHHRGHHHRHRADRARRTRHRQLPQGHQGQGRRTEESPAHQAQVPREWNYSIAPSRDTPGNTS